MSHVCCIIELIHGDILVWSLVYHFMDWQIVESVFQYIDDLFFGTKQLFEIGAINSRIFTRVSWVNYSLVRHHVPRVWNGLCRCVVHNIHTTSRGQVHDNQQIVPHTAIQQTTVTVRSHSHQVGTSVDVLKR